MTKSELLIKQMGLLLIISNVTNDINELCKNHNFNPFQSSSLSIRASVAVAMLLIPSSHVLSSYFYVSLSLVEVSTVSILINFTTQLLCKKKKRERRKKRKKGRKKERKKLV